MPTPNPFEEAGREAERFIVGDLLKFSKGEWLAGQENMEIPMGTRLLANMDMLMRGWVRWEDNKPAEQIMGLVVEGYVAPKRNTLGWGYDASTKNEDDADKTDWLIDNSGIARDPWQETWYLPLRELDKNGEPTGSLFTFAASSTGGRDAVKQLCGVYGKAMRYHPDEFPVVALGYDAYTHSNPQYGKIKTPEFVTGYISAEQARSGTKTKLFDVNKDWLPKSAFGPVDQTAAGEEIPF